MAKNFCKFKMQLSLCYKRKVFKPFRENIKMFFNQYKIHYNVTIIEFKTPIYIYNNHVSSLK